MSLLARVLRLIGPTHGRPPLFLSTESKRHDTHGTRLRQKVERGKEGKMVKMWPGGHFVWLVGRPTP
jgi:hypothetical protein